LTLPDVGTIMRGLLVGQARELRFVTTRTKYEYLASAVILWAAIWLAAAGVLDGAAFDDMIPMLGGGTVFFVVILPAGLFRRSRG
jgi:hypothetical protein